MLYFFGGLSNEYCLTTKNLTIDTTHINLKRAKKKINTPKRKLSKREKKKKYRRSGKQLLKAAYFK